MLSLSVAECLREADQQVRDITLDAGDLDSERLLAAWPPFLAAADRALGALRLPAPARPEPAAAALSAETGLRQWHPPAGIEGEPRLVAATELLDRAADLIARHASRTAPDRDQVSHHILATLCVGAHVVGRGAGEYLEATRAAVDRRIGHSMEREMSSQIPRATYTRQAERVARVEDLSMIALQTAGHHRAPRAEAPDHARVEEALNTWATTCTAVLQSGKPAVDDLRLIAQIQAQMERHTAVLAAAAAHAGVLDQATLAELVPALRGADAAWTAAKTDWPRHMASLGQRSSRELRQAATGVSQALAGVTHPDPTRWAAPGQIARDHDPGVLLAHVTAAHRTGSHLATNYQDAAAALIRSGQVTVAGREAFGFTGHTTAAARVTVPPGHLERVSYRGGRLAAAAEGARSALDTATAMTPQATQDRARIPLSMAAGDIDAAIRARVRVREATTPSTTRQAPAATAADDVSTRLTKVRERLETVRDADPARTAQAREAQRPRSDRRDAPPRRDTHRGPSLT